VLNAGGLGYPGNATSSIRNATEGEQESARLVVILQCRPKVLGGKFGIIAKLTNCSLVVGRACLAFQCPFPVVLQVFMNICVALRQRVCPAETREAREIAIGGMEHAAVFHG